MTDITIQILEVINSRDHYDDGINQTKLMSKLSLSHEQMKEYLVLLIENDLVSYDPTAHTFKATEKGLTFIQGYNQIDKILKQQQT